MDAAARIRHLAPLVSSTQATELAELFRHRSRDEVARDQVLENAEEAYEKAEGYTAAHLRRRWFAAAAEEFELIGEWKEATRAWYDAFDSTPHTQPEVANAFLSRSVAAARAGGLHVHAAKYAAQLAVYRMHRRADEETFDALVDAANLYAEAGVATKEKEFLGHALAVAKKAARGEIPRASTRAVERRLAA